MIKEFKEFISRGNVMDLAIGVIVGGAFNKIVSSLVNDILMPLIGVISGGIDFTSLSFTVGESAINYGMFIQNIIDFLIIAVCIFFLVKFLNNLSRIMKLDAKKDEEEVKEEKTPEVSEEILLLREINENLKKQNKTVKKNVTKK